MTNNSAGLRIVDLSTIATGHVEEIAFIDTEPEVDDVSFSGAWSNYPWLKDNKCLVNTWDRGIFMVQLDDGHISA